MQVIPDDCLAPVSYTHLRQAAEGSVEEEVLTAGLQEMNPLQIVKATFENSYQTEMPEELVNLFQEACRTINLE